MKQKLFLLCIAIAPTVLHAQSPRKGWYAGIGPGYGSYRLDLYNYNGGSPTYADQKFSAPLVWLGIDRKSILQKNNFVLDAAGTIEAGFGVTTKSVVSGPSTQKNNKGWLIGIQGLAKAGYILRWDHIEITPLVGAGPYFLSIQTGKSDTDGYSSQLYGAQGYAGADLRFNKITLTPQIHFGIAGWGNSDRSIGRADNVQNSQPSMLEAGFKVAVQF
ncbi:MAG: hypothetical protein KF862_21095 [Chitinophagaceae bacterium]|nr:hypothetical protein [Chitinophagaceae bacterium]